MNFLANAQVFRCAGSFGGMLAGSTVHWINKKYVWGSTSAQLFLFAYQHGPLWMILCVLTSLGKWQARG
jgi:hypothetical protein